MTILYRALQDLCLMTLTGCLVVVQAPDNVKSPFKVIELNSSVTASNRKFSCGTEEVVYRCVTQRTNNETFHTQWMWDGTTIGKVFNSDDRIGDDNTCNSPRDAELDFLHVTLVSTMNDTCVSLLIVIPSLMESNPMDTSIHNNVIITCTTFGDGEMPPQQSQEINHTVSSRPEWGDNDVINVNYECYDITNSTALDVLLKIAWPEITNLDDMDFDFYTLLIEIPGEIDSIVNSSTIKMDATSYECIFHVPKTVKNITTLVQINAVNRCKDTSNIPLRSSPIIIDKGNCKNLEYSGIKNQPQMCTGRSGIILGLTGLLTLYCING